MESDKLRDRCERQGLSLRPLGTITRTVESKARRGTSAVRLASGPPESRVKSDSSRSTIGVFVQKHTASVASAQTLGDRACAGGVSVDDLLDEQLIELALAHDARAWTQLVSVLQPVLFRLCRRCGVSPDCAHDIVQETFLSALKNMEKFRLRSSSRSIHAWFVMIARSRICDMVRKNRRFARTRLTSSSCFANLFGCAVDESSFKSHEDDCLRARFDHAMEYTRSVTSDGSWCLFYSVAVEGDTASEVARRNGTTTNCVYLAKSRVMRRLQDALQRLAIGGEH